ncbi:lipoate-protein ligase A [Clostridium punense]|uniref:lipoate--protein ligase n=1 Tax=Clostridium punense TaxID=1054297 RepID=A0ABS4K2W1_9CLOT|nr:lipoate--protein ligase [Clostridium punense]MBP2022115.1 lipoate-protein ligase A [Clostridium punense]
MVTKTRVVVSKSFDPYFNLALEELLLNKVEREEVILYLWQNEKTVVIGRNQNPWKECNLELLSRVNGKVARRLSGGGAVYHDLGNLNFTFLMREENEDLSKQLGVIIRALKELGIEAVFSGRNDILVDNKKISGNAFYREENKYYHHGTLLFDVDMEILPKILTPSIEKLQSKGIDSVKSRVINLKQCRQELTIDLLIKALIKAFEYYYGKPDTNQEVDESFGEVCGNNMEELYMKYSSDYWLYGDCPNFQVSLKKQFEDGSYELNLQVEDGKINKCKIYTDSIRAKGVNNVEALLEGCSFNKIEVIKRLKSYKDKYGHSDAEIINIIESICEDIAF